MNAPETPTQHEARDVSYGPVVAAGVVIVMLIVAAAMLVLPLMGALASREARRSEPVNPLAAAMGRALPPQPRLQTHPLDDMRVLREAEAAALGSYAWVDEEAGIMRIPIERAIALLAADGSSNGEAP